MKNTANNIVYITMLLLCSGMQASDGVDMATILKQREFIKKAILSGSLEDFNKYVPILKHFCGNDLAWFKGYVKIQNEALCVVEEVRQNPRLNDCLAIIMQEFISHHKDLDTYIQKEEISADIKGDKDYERALKLLSKCNNNRGQQILTMRKKIVKLSEDEVIEFMSKERKRLESIDSVLQKAVDSWKTAASCPKAELGGI